MRPVKNRAGSIAPLTCVLLVLMVAMVAFAVDMSWLTLTRSELQNVADSAALAGANKLGDNYVLYSLPNQNVLTKQDLINDAVKQAKTAAKNAAAANAAGGKSGLALLDTDIEVGFTDATGKYKATSSSPNQYPNTFKVLMRRDGSANGSLNMFFAVVIGVSNIDVQAKASAMAYGGSVTSFRTDRGNAGLLPVTYDVNHWDTFVKTGLNPDGLVSIDSKGNPTLQIYPSIKDSGNFGYISLDDSHVGASDMTNWIKNGASPSDVGALISNGLIPLSGHDKTKWDWNGENGFKSSNVADINALVGQTFTIPLFTPKSKLPYEPGVGEGSNYDFNIVRFVGIKIVPSLDNNRIIMVQPAAITDPTAILDPNSIAALGTESSSTFVTALAPPKLSE